MGKDSIAFELFDTDLHRQWKQDRALRRCVPLNETWRGCIGRIVGRRARPAKRGYP